MSTEQQSTKSEFKYFISYFRGVGFGCTEYFTDTPIRDMSDIKNAVAAIEKQTGSKEIVVLYYREF